MNIPIAITTFIPTPACLQVGKQGETPASPACFAAELAVAAQPTAEVIAQPGTSGETMPQPILPQPNVASVSEAAAPIQFATAQPPLRANSPRPSTGDPTPPSPEQHDGELSVEAISPAVLREASTVALPVTTTPAANVVSAAASSKADVVRTHSLPSVSIVTATQVPARKVEDRPLIEKSALDPVQHQPEAQLVAPVVAPELPPAKPVSMQSPPLAIDIRPDEIGPRLAQEISIAPGKAREIVLRLAPEHLGTVEVAVSEATRGVVIQMTASNEEAAQLIAREEPRLVEEFRQRAMPVAEFSLHYGAGADGRQPRNGSIPQPYQPFTETDRHMVRDQDQDAPPERGRFA